MVLKFDFSGIQTGSPEITYRGFSFKVEKAIQQFFIAYRSHFSAEIKDEVLSQSSPEIMLSSLFTYAREVAKIFVVIDEYDHFTNELFSFKTDEFEKIVSQNGYVRKFYEEIKIGTQEGSVDRFFATGVSPVTLDNMTSGFNIGTKLTQDVKFNEMMGFTEAEVVEILRMVGMEESLIDTALAELRIWYNGYLFESRASTRMYNSDMVLFFANEYHQKARYPDTLLDTNISSDYSKIHQLFRLGGEEKERWDLLEKAP